MERMANENYSGMKAEFATAAGGRRNATAKIVW